jgi:hypothetical protein
MRGSGAWGGERSGASMRQQGQGTHETPAAVTVAEASALTAAETATTSADDGVGEAGAETEAEADAASAATSALSPAAAPPRAPGIPIKLLLLVAVVNLGLAFGLFALRPPQRVERITAVPAMPAQVAQLAAQVQRGEHGAPFDLVLTDDDLSATAGYFLAQSKDVPFGQVRAAVSGGHVEVSAVTTGLAVAVPVRIQTSVVARDGAPVVQVLDVGVGGVPLPTFAHDQVLREANRAVDLSRYNLPVTVDSIELRPGVLEARGTVK